MRKIIRLTESDLRKIVKRVIKEDENNDFDPLQEVKIELPKKFKGIRAELGDKMSIEDIIETYNSEVEEGTKLVKLCFLNEDDYIVDFDIVIDELDYALVGDSDEEEDEYDDEEGDEEGDEEEDEYDDEEGDEEEDEEDEDEYKEKYKNKF